MRSWLAVIVLAGCGRIGFDAAGRGDDVEFPRCELGRPELCNGFDDDCDSAIDEGCPCAEQVLDAFSTFAYGPAIAWTGDGYGLAWSDGLGKFVSVMADGTKREVDLPTGVMTQIGGLTWTGDRFVATVLDVLDYGTTDPKVRLRALILGRDGTVESEGVLAFPGYDPRQLVLPEGPAVVYMKSAELVLAIVGESGAAKRELALPTPPGKWNTRVAGGTRDFVILGHTTPTFENGQLSLARFDAATGAMIGTPIMLGGPMVAREQYALAWIGGAYAILWIEGGSPAQVWLAQLATNGTLGTPVSLATVTDAIGYPDLAWSGASLVAAWQQYQPAAFRTHATVARITTSGARIVPDRTIAGDGNAPFPSSRIALAAGRVGVVWPQDVGDNVAAPLFAQICD